MPNHCRNLTATFMGILLQLLSKILKAMKENRTPSCVSQNTLEFIRKHSFATFDSAALHFLVDIQLRNLLICVEACLGYNSVSGERNQRVICASYGHFNVDIKATFKRLRLHFFVTIQLRNFLIRVTKTRFKSLLKIHRNFASITDKDSMISFRITAESSYQHFDRHSIFPFQIIAEASLTSCKFQHNFLYLLEA